MTKKRFIFEQNGNFHTVIDTVENKPMGVFEFKENEFPVYACFHMIIDKMNGLYEENLKLKSENNMLRATIGRNEAYIERLKHKGEWKL